MTAPDAPTPPPVPPIAPGYAPPPGYGQAPGYGQGPTYAPPYTLPGAAPVTFAPEAKPSSRLGVVALILALVAAVVAPLVGAVAATSAGAGADAGALSGSSDFDWAVLSPVRDQVLYGEIAFWAGTVLGIWALVQGIVAVSKRAGRGQGIAAIVVACIGPAIFWFVVLFAFGIGVGMGAAGAS